MDPVLASAFISCLRISDPAVADLGRLAASRYQWDRTLEWLDHSGITLSIWQRLKDQENISVIPPEVGQRLERNLAEHRLRVEEMVAEFDAINQCWEEAGIKYAALKGLALIHNYCPDIFLRTTYDYDYLLARDSIAVADAVLGTAGYIRKEDPNEHPIVYFHQTRRPRSPLSRDDLYSAAFPRTVELHYLFWDPEELKIPLDIPRDPMAQLKLRKLRLPANPQGSSGPENSVHFYALAEEDELLFQVLHAFRHILQDWCRLCSLFDIAYFLDHRAQDKGFWDRFLGLLQPSRELSEIVGVVFMLAAGVFGAPIPARVADRTTGCLRRPLVSWVERYGMNSALQNFSDNKFSLFLHHEFVHDAAAWRRILRSRLFPMHRPNQAVQASSSAIRSRLTAGWRQRRYVAYRLKHHLMAILHYGLESPRWNRARSRDV